MMRIPGSFYSFSVLLLTCTFFFSCQRNGQTTVPATQPVAEATPATDTTETAATPDTAVAEGSLDTVLPAPISPVEVGKSDYVIIITDQADGTFGYNLLHHGALLISQPNIPGTAGTAGFKTKEQAFAAASLVKTKLENGITPPSITEKELKKILKD